MRVTKLTDAEPRPRHVAVGEFDGVHLGHREVIAGNDTVLTFEPHPLRVVRPEAAPKLLTSLAVKAELIAGLGVEELVVIPFDDTFAAQTPMEFIDHVLVERLGATRVSVGENFRFGHGGQGTSVELAAYGRRHGFEVIAVALEREGGEPVSSTRIRGLIGKGRVAEAALLLGRPHRVEGVVVRGHGRGAQLGFPTANVAPPMYSAIPADGVYAAWFTVLGHGPVTGTVVPGERYQAAVSIGTNPTFSGRTRTVEAFVLDSEADLYGQHVAVDFVARLRGQLKFDSIRDLVVAMGKDTDKARQILASHS
jgi:riboflavin kinase / FMN adenylyltransferase